MRKGPVDGWQEVFIGGMWVIPETLATFGFDYDEAEKLYRGY